jgi:hypothetical protein
MVNSEWKDKRRIRDAPDFTDSTDKREEELKRMDDG